MQIISISRGTFSGGKALAEKMAAKLDCLCLSREELIEEATKAGIPVGKLEEAMLKPQVFSERLALEREHYRAFSIMFICERAMESERIVYHGRTGHLLFPGISHVLRIRVIADMEYRINAAMQRLNLDREKAKQYIEEVEESRRRWVHFFYGVSWDESSHYDVIVNLEQMNVDNAASALCNMAQLPDFQMTPASERAMKDLWLAAKARLLLAQDARTARCSFKVRAENGVVNVSYLPRDAKVGVYVPQVLEKLEGLKELRHTISTTNILWIQEKFDPNSEIFGQITEIADKWNAAVELLRMSPDEEEIQKESYGGELEFEQFPQEKPAYTGGIEDDVIEPEPRDDGGLKETLNELIKSGRSGGGRSVGEMPRKLLDSIDRSVTYSLVVIGNVFLSKGEATRKRMVRELQSLLTDNLKVPVVTAEDLKSQYLFGAKDLPKLIAFLIITIIFYTLVFTHQEPILNFLSAESWVRKCLAAIAVALFVPLIAYIYGSVTSLILKLIKME
jgi:cytidylate kinase